MKMLPNMKWFTVGMKLLVGVGVTSNICIGSLLYINWNANQGLSQTMDELLIIREHDSSNLRQTVVDLQKKLLSLGDFFQVDPREAVRRYLVKVLHLEKEESVRGRERYAGQYSRIERRNLQQKAGVIQQRKGKIIASWGLFDEEGKFANGVQQLTFVATPTSPDYQEIVSMISAIEKESGTGEALQQKVHELKAHIVDEALAAEMVRTEILNITEQITAKEKGLHEKRMAMQRFVASIGIGTLAVNLIVLFILTRIIVERPLYRLTRIIDEIREGKSPDIPCQHRGDQIGILSGAVKNFKEVLVELSQEDERKLVEKTLLHDLSQVISQVIEELEAKAQNLVNLAERMEELAGTTKEQSARVAYTAGQTAENTKEVSFSTSSMQQSVSDITRRIVEQRNMVQEITVATKESHQTIEQLTRATLDANSIIEIVRGLSDQIKLLALNATIEAARAGDVGNGFAVVAAEVKVLSQKTEQATEEIMSRIRTIDGAGRGMIQAVRNIEGQVNALHEVTDTLSQTMEKQELQTRNIRHLASTTSEHTRDVSENILQVGTAANDTLDLSGLVHQIAQDIAVSLTELLGDTTTRLQQISNNKGQSDFS